jgi:hypothetical protein
MSYAQNYLGRSTVAQTAAGSTLRFSPNLARPKVFFDGELRFPVRYREAMSALHEVVIGDLTFRPRDKTAYRAYREELKNEEARVRQAAHDEAEHQALLASFEQMPKNLETDFKRARQRYYAARSAWIKDLYTRDNKLWWLLDPVVTVAPDVVLFECFSKDESSYGCLTVDRDAFSHEDAQGLGTTNVDYSLALFEHFQTLRSYRPTRLTVDPQGFEVQVTGRADYREEKIDLPPSWLRGFAQIQAAQLLPATLVTLSREAVYSLVAHLTRHREKKGPRALRFELEPGTLREGRGGARLVLEPWAKVVSGGDARGGASDQDGAEVIRVWGRRRLSVLARILPLVERVDVYLLGSGLPSVWVARLGEMTFTLALSGWTANDWTSGANLDLLAGRFEADPRVTARALALLEKRQHATLAELKRELEVPEHAVVGSLHRLALAGQAIFDHAHQLYRYRLAMPEPIPSSLIEGARPELSAAQAAVVAGKVTLERNEMVDGARTLLGGRVGGTHCETLLDADGVFQRARCTCKHFHRFKLRAGPCRHLLALKLAADPPRFGDKPHLVS